MRFFGCSLTEQNAGLLEPVGKGRVGHDLEEIAHVDVRKALMSINELVWKNEAIKLGSNRAH